MAYENLIYKSTRIKKEGADTGCLNVCGDLMACYCTDIAETLFLGAHVIGSGCSWSLPSDAGGLTDFLIIKNGTGDWGKLCATCCSVSGGVSGSYKDYLCYLDCGTVSLVCCIDFGPQSYSTGSALCSIACYFLPGVCSIEQGESVLIISDVTVALA